MEGVPGLVAAQRDEDTALMMRACTERGAGGSSALTSMCVEHRVIHFSPLPNRNLETDFESSYSILYHTV